MANPSPNPTAAIEPLDVGDSGLSTQTEARWIWTFLIVGLTLRVVRYALRFPLWEDEAMLSANYLDRGYLELLRPLNYLQVVPPLFLWSQLSVIKLLGYTEYTLRLIPFLCGLGSLALFRHVAGRLLRGTALVLAVALFAVSYLMTRYSAEAKPYGCDLLLTLVMLALVIEWLRARETGTRENRWLWWLAALVGPAVGFSFPTVFVAGGLSPLIAYVLWSSRRRGWIPWAVFNGLLVASFAAVMLLSRASVGQSNQNLMQQNWSEAFPPMTQPLRLIVWLVETHAGGMLGYPVGGPNWGSTLSMLLALVGVVVLVRRRSGLVFAMLVAPLALNFVAAAMHRFPYGGHARMTLFLAPAFCILIALGIAGLLALARPRRSSNPQSPIPNPPLLPAALALLLLLGTGSLLRDLTHPYKSGTVQRARDFARWFWFNMSQEGELVCFETDLKQCLSTRSNTGWSSLYFCNQRIYSPRHARGFPPQFARISADWPLRCAVYRSPREEHESPPPDPKVVEHWLEQMQLQYRLVSRDAYPFPAYDKADPRTQEAGVDHLEIYTFVPKGRN